jgi:hypothetical protein
VGSQLTAACLPAWLLQERYEALLASRDQQLDALMAELQRLRQGSSSGGTSACGQGPAGGRASSEEPQARRGTPLPVAQQQHQQHATPGPGR